jgi:hypothetical protein
MECLHYKQQTELHNNVPRPVSNNREKDSECVGKSEPCINILHDAVHNGIELAEQ